MSAAFKRRNGGLQSKQRGGQRGGQQGGPPGGQPGRQPGGQQGGPPPLPAWPGTGKTHTFALEDKDTRLVYNWTQTGPSSRLTQYASMFYYLTKVIPQYLFEYTRYKFRENYFTPKGRQHPVPKDLWDEKNPAWRTAFADTFENETDLQALLSDPTKAITEGRFEISSFANLTNKYLLGKFGNPYGVNLVNPMYIASTKPPDPFKQALFDLKKIRNMLAHGTRDFIFKEEFDNLPDEIERCADVLMTEFTTVPLQGLTFNDKVPGIIEDFDKETKAALALMRK